MAITIGITGGIGSGKSTVSNVFRLLGIPVFEADVVAKQLMNSNEQLKTALKAIFDNEIYTHDGLLDRKKLAGYIFNNNELLEKVNNIVHPLVRQAFHQWHEIQETKYVIHEAAILFESGFYKMMDFTILITAPEQIRIERVAKRDGISSEEVKHRISKQWSDEIKRPLATIELINDNKNLIIPQIVDIDKKLKADGKIW